MLDAAFTPPAPKPRIIPPGAGPSLQGYLRYFRIMAHNPLEIWTDGHFNRLLHHDRLFGRSYAVVHDPEVVRHYLVANAGNYGLTKLRKALFEPLLGRGLLVAEGDLWRRTRKALTPAFTHRHVRDFAPVMRRVAEARADALAQRAGETAPMTREMMTLALDVLIACLFSDDSDLDTALFSQRIDELLKLAGMPHPLDLVDAPAWMPRFGRGKAYKVIGGLRAQVAAVLKERRLSMKGGDDAPNDFLGLLLQAGVAEGAPLSDEEVIDNLITFLSAGHETTARTLTWTLYLISKAPSVYDRILDELDNADLASTAPETWSDALPYLTAVLKESMRLYPSASILSRLSLGPDTLGDIAIAPDTEVITSPWVLHRHRRLWRDPDIFDPDRFLGEAAKAIPRYAYIPFGTGPRVCIGASFSMQETMIVLPVLLKKLRFDFADAEDPTPIMRITIQPSTDVNMRISLR